MLFFRNHNYKKFVESLLTLINLAKIDLDNHAMTMAMQSADKTDLWLEFGVFEGTTLNQMSLFAPNKLLYAFDSFRGLPERWRSVNYNKKLEKYVKKGAFNKNGNPPKLSGHNVAFVIGWFNETLPLFLKEHYDKKISFVHIDSDIYSSSYYVLEKIKPMLSNNSILVFDELVNYPEYIEGELRAIWDVFKNTDCSIEVVSRSFRKLHKKPKYDIWPQAVSLKLRVV